jgi:hypothetical protein
MNLCIWPDKIEWVDVEPAVDSVSFEWRGDGVLRRRQWSWAYAGARIVITVYAHPDMTDDTIGRTIMQQMADRMGGEYIANCTTLPYVAIVD